MEEIRDKQRILKGYFITHWEWWALLATLLFSAYVRYRLLAIPLERDEGEYAYAGQLILQGIPPYLGVYNMKLPGVYAAYAAILALFGQTISGIHFGLLLINAITTFMIFLVGKRLANTLAGVVAAASFALLSLGQSIHGLSANAEHFVIIAVVAGLLLLLRAIRDDRPWLLFTSGLMFGIGLLMKQHGAVFAAFALIYVLVRQLGKGEPTHHRDAHTIFAYLPAVRFNGPIWKVLVLDGQIRIILHYRGTTGPCLGRPQVFYYKNHA